jgi:DMSO/TMAO reductase YedYZ molybdopterin-dependent catalytic subunit
MFSLTTKLPVLMMAMLISTFSIVPGYADPRPSNKIVLVDLNKMEFEFTLDELRDMPQEIEEQCICVGESSGFIGIFDYRGVRLNDILNFAKAANEAGSYRKENMYVVFKGTDGYQVITSWTELHQPPNGKRALLVLEKDGKTLDNSEGALRLYFPGDKYVGRSVKWLERIEIRCIEGVVEKK